MFLIHSPRTPDSLTVCTSRRGKRTTGPNCSRTCSDHTGSAAGPDPDIAACQRLSAVRQARSRTYALLGRPGSQPSATLHPDSAHRCTWRTGLWMLGEPKRSARNIGRKHRNWRRGPGSNRRIKVLQTSPLPLGYRATASWSETIPARPGGEAAIWSGRRDLNPRPSPWQGDALPLSYSRLVQVEVYQCATGRSNSASETPPVCAPQEAAFRPTRNPGSDGR